MGLISHAVAAGIGYTLGRPDGRRKLDRLRQQLAEYGRSPEVQRVRDSALAVVAERVPVLTDRTATTPAGPTPGRDDQFGPPEGPGRGRFDWRRPRPHPGPGVVPSGPTPGPAGPAGTANPPAAEGVAAGGPAVPSPLDRPVPPVPPVDRP
jgi:hypothetical protein